MFLVAQRGWTAHLLITSKQTLVCAKTLFHLCGIYQWIILKLLSQNLTRIHLIGAWSWLSFTHLEVTNYQNKLFPPHPPHTQKKKKNWKKPVIHLGCHLRALVFSRMPWFQVSKISFSNRWWHNDSKQKTTLLVLLPFCYLEWPRQNFSLQYQYNTKQTSNEIKEKYKLGDYNVIQYQILQTWTV